MDLLYTENFDGFCLVSSDSDFTKLASRLREAGLFVYGFGRKQAPVAFQKACDKFTYTEILGEQEEDSNTSIESKPASDRQESVQAANKNGRFKKDQKLANSEEADKVFPKELVSLLKRAYEATAGEDGLANLGPFGSQILKISPAFDPRSYGYGKLGAFIRDTDLFEIQEVSSEHNPAVKVLYVKLKG